MKTKIYQLTSDEIKKALIAIYNLKVQVKDLDSYLKLYNTEIILKNQLVVKMSQKRA